MEVKRQAFDKGPFLKGRNIFLEDDLVEAV